MANVLNPNFDYTYNGILSTDLFYKPIVEYPDLLNVFQVRQNVRFKEELNLVVPLGKITKGAQGCGDLQTTGDPVQITNRTLETCALEIYLEQCADTFENTILDVNQRSGEAWYDMIGTPLGNAVQRQIVESAGRDLFRILSFGDTSSPAGDPDYYGVCDGLWTRLIDGTSSYETKQVDAITTLDQSAGTRALDYLRNLYEQAPIILKQLPMNQRRFFVTGNVYENLMTTYENSALTGGGLTARVENGVTSLMFRGVDVVPVYAWDDWISIDNLGNNTRILYTTPSNHIVGLVRPSDQGTLRRWFDQNTNYVKFFGRYHVGYNYIHDELQAFSIGNV